MEPLDFMAAVLPPPGNGRYCAVELTDKKEHVYVEELDQLSGPINRWNEAKYDIYFALTTFGDEDKRVAANAKMSKCIAIDVDCNHPKDVPEKDGTIKPKAYASARLAAQAIMNFTEEVGLAALGNPWLVASGGGVHAYWPLTEAVTIDEWKPVAEAFKRLCVQKKLGIDPTVTGDAARVLRVPATTNRGFKGKKQVRGETNVRFMNEGDLFDLQDIRALLERELVGTAYAIKPITPGGDLVLPGKRPTKEPTSHVQLYANSITKFGNIFKATKQGRGCDQLRFYAENASDDGMEPLWRGMLSIAQKCQDGEKAAIWLSSLHPYDEDRMRTKLAEIKGPYPCTKFDSENPGVCTTCVHWGKITNPLALGRDTAISTEAKEVAVSEPTISEEVRSVLRPEPPKGYAYGANGGIFVLKDDEDADGNKVQRKIMIVPYDLFPVDILVTNKEHVVHMVALRPDGSQTVTLAQKSVVSKDETLKSLANQNVIASFGALNDNNLFYYIRASVEKMSMEKAPVRVPESYGWQKDDTFVFAGQIYSKGKPVAIPMAGLENIVNNTQPTGSIEVWRSWINLLIRHEMYDHLAIVLAGAGSPLMRFTGIYGMTYHCAARDSGTGKSLALEGAASIWGHPAHYRTGKSTSMVAMQQRLGLLNSLPLVTDEITSRNRETPNWFSEFLLDMTEGRGKERMESGANKERINNSTWMSNAIMSSNTYVVDSLTGLRKVGSEGEMRRLLEFRMNDKEVWTHAEVALIKSLQDNYGVAGHILADFYAKNVDMLKTFVPQIVEKMYDEYNATNDERFWMASVGANIAAGILMSDAHAGIVNFPLEKIIEAYGKRIEYQRVVIKSNKRTAEDVLNEFIRENIGRFVVVNFGTAGGVLAEMGNGAALGKNTTRSEVHGRIENGVTVGFSDFYIEERVLKTFCSTMNFGYAEFKEQLEKLFAIQYLPRKDLTAKTGAPPMRTSVIKITRPVDESLEDHLSVGKG
jgi:hypothetical protein